MQEVIMTESGQWGAGSDLWDYYDVVLGLKSDMLPVVSKAGATISARSSVKAIGKTPSLYNRNREVVGIAGWTDKKSSDKDLERWRREGDYGICIQTRLVRAIDVDVEDSVVAGAVRRFIEERWSGCAVRSRAGSGKFLVAVSVPGVVYKKVMPVAGGMIELLGNGRQFVSEGTHTAGERYVWANRDAMLEARDLETLWNELAEVFATGEVRVELPRREAAGVAGGESREGDGKDDPVLDYLTVLSRGRDGEAFIECPFVAEHTGGVEGSAETSTAYFPAGTGGYEMGHFKCLHAHCVGRGDWEFIDKLGVAASGFDVVTGEEAWEAGSVAVSNRGGEALDRVLDCNDDGKILATVGNLGQVLQRPDLCGRDIRYDTFRDEVVYSVVNCVERWVPFKDTDYTDLRIYLATTGFLPVAKEMIRDVVHYVAVLRRFDTAQTWLNGLQWDGVRRVEGFLSNYIKAEDGPYARAVSNYMWAAMAGRVLDPGCKADAAVIFVGEQYVGKTYAAASLVPDIRYFCEIRLDENENDLARRMRGKLVAEFAELRGLHTKELEGIKAFISRQYEEWVPKYMEFSTIYPRRLFFIGTSNKDEIFSDETGNRRWFPVRTDKSDIEAIIRDREHLWAEAAVLFMVEGVKSCYEKANNLADDVRAEFMIKDDWEDVIADWIREEDTFGKSPSTCEFLRISDIMREALNIDTRNMKTFDSMRVGKILRKLGYSRVQKRENGIKTKVWTKNIDGRTVL